MPERRKTLFITPEVHRQFKAKCAMRGESMQAVTDKLIERWLNEHEDDEDGRGPPDPGNGRGARAAAP